eukprot:GHVS01015176.1.p1 GENE.GHVS01015176.1~~GHVS01015176.1.p1  ORF type:complete len:902 (+),score=88.33 GHVS01015176.1:248-2707(+)
MAGPTSAEEEPNSSAPSALSSPSPTSSSPAVPSISSPLILSTEPVYKLGRLALLDALTAAERRRHGLPGRVKDAQLQEMVNRGVVEEREPQLKLPITREDVHEAFDRVERVRYRQRRLLSRYEGVDIVVRAVSAGHEVGGAVWCISLGGRDIIFGSRYNLAHEWHIDGSDLSAVRSPAAFITDIRDRPLGNHYWKTPAIKQMLRYIGRVITEDRGSVLLPIDCDGRLLELLLHLDHFWSTLGSTVSICSIVVLSPFADVLLVHAKTTLEWMSSRIRSSFSDNRSSPFGSLKNTKFLTTMEEFRALPKLPMVVLCSPSTLDGGFSRELLDEFVANPVNFILFPAPPIEGSFAHWLWRNGWLSDTRRDEDEPKTTNYNYITAVNIPDTEAYEIYLREKRTRDSAAPKPASSEEAEGAATSSPKRIWRDTGMPRRRRIIEPPSAARGDIDITLKSEAGDAVKATVTGPPGSLSQKGDRSRSVEQRMNTEEPTANKTTTTPEWMKQLITWIGRAPCRFEMRGGTLRFACKSRIILGFEGVCSDSNLRCLISQMAPRRLVLLPSSSATTARLLQLHVAHSHTPVLHIDSFWTEAPNDSLSNGVMQIENGAKDGPDRSSQSPIHYGGDWTRIASVKFDLPIDEAFIQLDENRWNSLRAGFQLVPTVPGNDRPQPRTLVAPLKGVVKKRPVASGIAASWKQRSCFIEPAEQQLPDEGDTHVWQMTDMGAEKGSDDSAAEDLDSYQSLLLGELNVRAATGIMKERLPEQVFIAPQGKTVTINDKAALTRQREKTHDTWKLEGTLDPSYFYARRLLSQQFVNIAHQND